MDQEKVRKVRKTVQSLKESVIERIPSVADSSPDTLSEELEMLAILLDLEMKLAIL